ncbi:hypothetical protein GCM10009839_26460 [Catenulispora yoronensis]|uniref:Uncharacterized protein n=1 Tax=Catenulispora yoronensis TaxID=450799 RepID=A0ABN2U2X2_9ACTN
MQEEDFRARLDAELDAELGPPIGTLVAAATAAGERRRRRRTIVQLTAGTAGVAAVAVGAVFAAGHVGSGPGAPAAVGPGVGAVAAPRTTAPPTPAVTPTTPTTSPATPATETSTPLPGTSTSGQLPTEYESSEIGDLPPVPSGQARTTAQSMLLLLEQNVTRVGGPGDFSHTFGYAPTGNPGEAQKTMFLGDLYWNHTTISVSYTLPPKKQADPKKKVPPGGDVFRWDTPGVTGTSEVKLAKSARGVELTRTDGSRVMVLETNGPGNGLAGPDRADLPLTSDQLLSIARDSRWEASMGADFVAQAQTAIELESTPY